jgi:hypothetical protein
VIDELQVQVLDAPLNLALVLNWPPRSERTAFESLSCFSKTVVTLAAFNSWVKQFTANKLINHLQRADMPKRPAEKLDNPLDR